MITVREIDASSEVELVAARMRATLVEVLGEERGGSMYTREWLVERVRYYVREGVVLVAERDGIAGHAFARIDDGLGHFGTIYVEPGSRRLGVASALIAAIHEWLRARGVGRVRYFTGENNAKLVALFEKHGYATTARDGEARMVELSRTL